jgi:hypothetical protein
MSKTKQEIKTIYNVALKKHIDRLKQERPWYNIDAISRGWETSYYSIILHRDYICFRFFKNNILELEYHLDYEGNPRFSTRIADILFLQYIRKLILDFV